MPKRVFIAGSCRTPVGAFGSRLKSVPAQELLRVCFQETILRTGVELSLVDETIAGTCTHQEDAMNVSHVAALLAGLKEESVKEYLDRGLLERDIVAHSSTVNWPGFTVSKNCGSGLRAIMSAVQGIRAGDYETVLVGATENMSRTPFTISREALGYHYSDATVMNSLPHGLMDPLTGEPMGLTAEHVAEKYGITRREQDEFSVESHKRAFLTIRNGRFERQIVPVVVRERNMFGEKTEKKVSEDEGPKGKLTIAGLASYPPHFKKDGTITAGNSCTVNDGAASMLVLTEDALEKFGIKPEAEILGYSAVALDPSYMGEGPICAIPVALKKAGLTISDIDVFEANEAFAAVAIAAQKVLEIPSEKLNIYGGAIALGHPVGATGAILTVKAIHLLKDLDKECAVISLCVGNGQGVALVIRNIS